MTTPEKKGKNRVQTILMNENHKIALFRSLNIVVQWMYVLANGTRNKPAQSCSPIQTILV